MSRTRIVYTIPNFKTAGSQHVVLSLYRRVDRFLFDPYICVEKYPEKIPEDVPMDRRLVFEWGGNAFEDVLKFSYLLTSHKTDIVHSWDYKSNYLEPLASYFAGVAYLFTKKNNSWSERWKLKSFLSSHIAYDNPEMKDKFFHNNIFHNKISFIPHSVDTDVFKPLEAIPSENFNIACIGNIGRNKNQLFIIKTLKYLPQNIVLHLFGTEEMSYKQELLEYIYSNNLQGRVQFYGYIENSGIPEVFRRIDLFVLASIQEGQPVAIMEAMACGVPVLCSDSGGGARYLLSADSIFSLNDPKPLIDKILLIYTMEKSSKDNLIKDGIRKILEIHTAELEIQAYETLYKKLV
jgi:glycosyltransferase involved in cell wall biosynthesis